MAYLPEMIDQRHLGLWMLPFWMMGWDSDGEWRAVQTAVLLRFTTNGRVHSRQTARGADLYPEDSWLTRENASLIGSVTREEGGFWRLAWTLEETSNVNRFDDIRVVDWKYTGYKHPDYRIADPYRRSGSYRGRVSEGAHGLVLEVRGDEEHVVFLQADGTQQQRQWLTRFYEALRATNLKREG